MEKKEKLTAFDIQAALSSLDELEIPDVEEREKKYIFEGMFDGKDHLDTLCESYLAEDYYNVNDTEDLENAQDERDAEVAKAKLTRIERIVDLNAKTADDLEPSYVGKAIIQCPQCMTLFYKDMNDIERSEDDENIVNVEEICQHCGNTEGYMLIGKVDAIPEPKEEEEPTEEVEVEEKEEFSEEPEEETSKEEEDEEEVEADGGDWEDFDLGLDEEPEEEEEEKKEESFNQGSGDSLTEEVEQEDEDLEDLEEAILSTGDGSKQFIDYVREGLNSASPEELEEVKLMLANLEKPVEVEKTIVEVPVEETPVIVAPECEEECESPEEAEIEIAKLEEPHYFKDFDQFSKGLLENSIQDILGKLDKESMVESVRLVKCSRKPETLSLEGKVLMNNGEVESTTIIFTESKAKEARRMLKGNLMFKENVYNVDLAGSIENNKFLTEGIRFKDNTNKVLVESIVKHN